MSKHVVLIHAMTAAIGPTLDAFAEWWPEAHVSSLLDDGLPAALRREGGLTPAIVARICGLAAYGAQTGADAVLFTCSAFTPAMDLAKRQHPIPVLKPDEAMVAAALATGLRIGVLATFPETISVSASQFRAAAQRAGKSIEIVTGAVPDALTAINAGDPATHDRLIAAAAAKMAPQVDVLCLAQFSMARARAAVQAVSSLPVLTSPDSAVAHLRAAFTDLQPR
jgi:Asp/Glu/hydantoin racemase